MASGALPQAVRSNQREGISVWCPYSQPTAGVHPSTSCVSHCTGKRQALLPQNDRSTRYFSRNIVNCCKTARKNPTWTGLQ